MGEDKHYDLALENQHGDAIMLDKADQEALITGLSLHDRGKGLMEKVFSTSPQLPEVALTGHAGIGSWKESDSKSFMGFES